MLAKKFASLYYLLEDLLSPQKHYDWGLRAIKSVLVVAGSLLRAEEGQLESNVLFRALRDLNIAKILAQVRTHAHMVAASTARLFLSTVTGQC
jgi:dynein heavy chain